jgi:hypothetical protein
MRLYVSDSYYLPDLRAYLGRYRHAVVTEVGTNELEVSLLGSFNDAAMRMELYLLVRAWEDCLAAPVVELVPPTHPDLCDMLREAEGPHGPPVVN